MPPELWPFQADVIARTRARVASGARRVILQSPTGGGKTTIAAEIIRLAVARGRRALFVVHRRRLVTQAADRIKLFGVPCGVVMAGRPAAPAPVQVASRDTLLSRGVRGGLIELPPADLVVVDEAHTSVSPKYREILDAYAAAVLLGTTATPARTDGRGLSPFYQAIECTASSSQLIREGRLVPVRCYGPPRKPGAKAKGLAGDPVAHWLRYGEGRPTVLFSSKVANSLAACDAFNAAGVPAEHIDAHTPDPEREAVVDRLRSGKTKVVANVGIWTEGVDIPELSCCVLLRMARSYVLYAQAVGRVMRAHPSKTDAVLIDHAGAVFEHGFPDEDVEWTLDPADTVERRVREAKEEGRRKEPVCCPGCGMLFSGVPACPQCGRAAPRRRERAASRDELLVEIARGHDENAAFEARQRIWNTCLFVMARRNQTAAAAACMFKQKTGDWPDPSLANVPPPWERQKKVADLYPQYARQGVPR